jgi:hypothetical protein
MPEFFEFEAIVIVVGTDSKSHLFLQAVDVRGMTHTIYLPEAVLPEINLGDSIKISVGKLGNENPS